ncbi:MAG: hypothetical protein P8Z36_12095 [Gemmatimonadota bacterium]|jgi:hypothetical protein
MKPANARIMLDGLIVGLIGYAVIAVFYGVLGLGTGGGVFRTAGVLGSALFYGARDGQLVAGPGPVFAANGLHLIVMLVLGLAAAWLVATAEGHPSFWYPVFFLFLSAFVLNYVAVLVLLTEVGHLVPWWSSALANLLAAVGMGAYLWWAHPRLREELRHLDERGFAPPPRDTA